MSPFAYSNLSRDVSESSNPQAGFQKEIRSTLVSKNITVSGRRTSVRLEPQMWQGLSDICRRERATLHEVCTHVAAHKGKTTSLTAAIRVFIMDYFRAATTEEGHMRARHGQGLLVDSGSGSGVSSPHAVNPLAIVAGTVPNSSPKAAEAVCGAYGLRSQH